MRVAGWLRSRDASDRLDVADAERSTTPLTAAEREQFVAGLHLNYPRWIIDVLIFTVFPLAAFLSRVRELTLQRTWTLMSARPNHR